MSAPDTNIEKQAKRHKGPLGGFALIAIFIVLITAAYSIYLVSAGDAPEGTAEQIDGRTGEVVEGSSADPVAIDTDAAETPAATGD